MASIFFIPIRNTGSKCNQPTLLSASPTAGQTLFTVGHHESKTKHLKP